MRRFISRLLRPVFGSALASSGTYRDGDGIYSFSDTNKPDSESGAVLHKAAVHTQSLRYSHVAWRPRPTVGMSMCKYLDLNYEQ